ncbi:SRPBCC family protein [Cryptosporangium sp. NPDC051539]|uniref:SRPBCC family protein n=1 Tax=Cryptosporangium sp. NPDC051539 TaxID=3363962 RepID=UPI0037B0E198
MTRTVDAVRREITVDVGPATAFEIFTADMTSWWPADHHIGAAPIEQIVVEPAPGGRWYTRHTDGSETSTGFVTVWEPPTRLVVTWQIGADWTFDPDLVTSVDVRFHPVGEGRTRVVLEHRGLEAYGAQAEAMRTTFEDPGAWSATLAAYASGVPR